MIQLHNNDCMSVFPQMEDNSVNLTLTDIPYDEVNRKSGGLRNLDKSHADIITFPLDDFIDEVVRVTSGSIYIFCGSVQVSHIRDRLIEHKLSVRHCIWEKTNPSPMNGQHIWLSSIENCVFAKKSGATFNEHCQSAVWRCSVERYKDHPTPKPVKLMTRLIEASSNVGDTVFDPCMGSGAVGVAAKQCGRDFIGVEMNQGYYDLTEKRINGVTESVLSFM
jgi:DNA modification methylase|tara:strand:- start:69 stop:731 length:663 start_codon:yes stop_codon:yes gene_type:complete